jgi:hypothetical protein
VQAVHDARKTLEFMQAEFGGTIEKWGRERKFVWTLTGDKAVEMQRVLRPFIPPWHRATSSE